LNIFFYFASSTILNIDKQNHKDSLVRIMKEKLFLNRPEAGQVRLFKSGSCTEISSVTIRRMSFFVSLLAVFLMSGAEATAVDRYSVASGNWSSTLIWAETSGGTAGASVPAAGDNVFIEGGYTVTLDVNTENIAALNIVTGCTLNGSSILNLSGSVSVTYAATGTDPAVISCPLALGAACTFNVVDDDDDAATIRTALSVSGVISGSFGITKAGNGMMLLSGANTFTGVTSVPSAATGFNRLYIQNAAALGTADGGTILSAGAVLGLTGDISINGETLSINNTTDGALRNISGNNTWSGAITLAAAISRISSEAGTLTITNTITGTDRNIYVTGAGNTIISGNITMGTGIFFKYGTGTLVLTGSNSYTGQTEVYGGVLNIQNSQALGSTDGGTIVAVDCALELQGGITVGAESLKIRGTGVNNDGVIRNVSGNNTWGGVVLPDVLSNLITCDAGTLTFDVASGTNAIELPYTQANSVTFDGAGNIIVADPISISTGTVTKRGTGTLTLSAENTYTGTTTVTAGVLQYGSSNALSTGNVNMNGGTISTGATTGYSDVVGTLTLSDNSTITLATGSHSLAFAGSSAVSWATGKTLTVTGWQGTAGATGTAGKILFGSSAADLTSTQLSRIFFIISGSYYGATILSTGEVVPSSEAVITTSKVSGFGYCAGDVIPVTFTYDPISTFALAKFTVQMSDISGSFASPVNLESASQNGTGTQTINVTLPPETLTGTYYRVRVISDVPQVIGSPNSNNLVISGDLTDVTMSSAAAQDICVAGSGTALTVEATGGYNVSFQWGYRTVSGGEITIIEGATGDTYTPAGSDLGEGISYIVCTGTTLCGDAIVSDEVKVTAFAEGYWIGGSSDWNNEANWCGGIPASSSNVIIPSSVSNQPVISGTPEGTCNNLTLNTGTSLTINAGQALTVNGDMSNAGTVTIKSSGLASSGSLIVNGSGSGNVTYERQLATGDNGDYHFFSMPVASNSEANAGTIGTVWGWDEVTATWPVTTLTALESGKGYNLSQAEGSDGLFSFTGPVTTSSVSITATSPYATSFDGTDYDNRTFATGRDALTNWGGGGWNLLGNPFTSAISVPLFTAANESSFDPNYLAVYLYDGSVLPDGEYNYNRTEVQAGQGFMVVAMNDGVTFSFTPGTSGMQIHAPGATFLKSARTEGVPLPGLKLTVHYGDYERYTNIIYEDNMKAGLDPGYDIGLLSTKPAVELYTALVVDNGVNFARQALPIIDCDKNVVAIGVDSKDGGEVTFAAITVPLPGYQYYLEDRTAGTFTELGVDSYTVTLPADTYGTGRFFLHTKDGVPTGTDPDISDPLDMRIWAYGDAIMIQGAVSSKATCTIFNVQGNMIHNQRLTDGTMNTIPMKSSAKGVYIVVVNDEGKIHRQKVVMF